MAQAIRGTCGGHSQHRPTDRIQARTSTKARRNGGLRPRIRRKKQVERTILWGGWGSNPRPTDYESTGQRRRQPLPATSPSPTPPPATPSPCRRQQLAPDLIPDLPPAKIRKPSLASVVGMAASAVPQHSMTSRPWHGISRTSVRQHPCVANATKPCTSLGDRSTGPSVASPAHLRVRADLISRLNHHPWPGVRPTNRTTDSPTRRTGGCRRGRASAGR
jgi:hypothetical protein